MSGGVQGDVLVPPSQEEVCVFPLSFAQERLWFLEQLQPGQATYNMYDMVPWHGDLATLERALAALVARHETLRTSFDVEDGQPVQIVAQRAMVSLAVIDLPEGTFEARRAAAEAAAVAEAGRPFELGRAPLLRARVLRADGEAQWLVLTVHHIVSDGWSMRVLLRELSELYDACATGRVPVLAALPIQYPDYAVWQRDWLTGPALEAQLAYWRKALGDAPPLLELPADRARPATPSYCGALHNFTLDAGLTEAVRRFAKAEGATPFMVLLAAFKLLLARLCGRDDILVGTPIANRTRTELEGLVGFFANTLVLRSPVAGERGFRALVARVRETTLSAYAHQDMPFERLVEALRPERALNHNPLFQVMFVLNAFDGPGGGDGPGGDAEYREFGLGTAKFDLHFSMVEVGGRLRGIMEYATDLFDADSVARMAGQFETLLRAALDEPEAPVMRLPLMAAAEREAALAASHSPWPEPDAPPLAHEAVAAQAARTPDAAALRAGARVLSYREMERAAERLAGRLAAAGVGPDVPVGIYLPRSPEQIVAVLAVLKAGGCYLPLDPAYPERRLTDAALAAELAVVIADPGAPPPFPVPLLLAPDDGGGCAAPLPVPSREALAYVLFTSGSTGRPKGVAMPHGPLANLIAWQIKTAGPAARVLQFTSLNFDVSAQEIFATLASGGTLVIASEEERRDPALLLRCLAEEKVERLFLPAAALQALAIAAEEARATLALREIVTAGEQLQMSPPLRRFVTDQCIALLRNQYGPTETHVASECTLEGDAAHWPELPPIGRAIAGGRLYVLDRCGAMPPAGVPGELHIGGLLLARGYLGRPGETAARFVPDPYGAPGARMYRTGDLARRRADGALEFLGRCDRQLKVRGVRVEPGEVEAVLREAPGVHDAAVVDGPDPAGAGGRRLLAYVVAEDTDAEALRRHCRARLPEPLVPSLIALLPALPLTPSGKVDRAALPDIAPEPPRDGDTRPRNPLEAAIAGIWGEVLKLDPIAPDANFFDLGGHSLLATRVMARIRARLGVDLPLRTLFERPTVAELAEAILDRELEQDPAAPPPTEAQGATHER